MIENTRSQILPVALLEWVYLAEDPRLDLSIFYSFYHFKSQFISSVNPKKPTIQVFEKQAADGFDETSVLEVNDKFVVVRAGESEIAGESGMILASKRFKVRRIVQERIPWMHKSIQITGHLLFLIWSDDDYEYQVKVKWLIISR